ncbi:MAG: glycerophosphodiester phosphodiesterase family protein [Actinomycetaceae bacterium]|nr:glycerophosphodiester phosphodiesterase family protein [Actinomycetaceae bacterium]MDY6082750.1 glycerophosphodiester phosphodiesterase family protein [Actinomycetaceae bacterium]
MVKRIYPLAPPVLVIAHRGGSGSEDNPHENSREVFERAAQRGFHYIETDSHVTADGVPILFHDETLMRTFDTEGYVEDFDYDALVAIAAAKNIELLTVGQALQEFPDLVFNIDAKTPGVVDPLIAAVTGADAWDRVCFASFSQRRLNRIRRHAPRAVTSLGVSGSAKLVLAAGLGVLWPQMRRFASGDHTQSGVQAVQVPVVWNRIPVLTPAFIQNAHARGLAVQAWTINDPEQAVELAQLGVDAIITDTPISVFDALARAGVEVTK